jgi:nicotinate-nucleotide adenylyltransferase
MRVGLFGGTFNPIHNGHLIIAQECWYQLELDKVIFIPAFIAPHKKNRESVSAADRLNMLRIALEGYSRFEISTYEIDKNGVSYTIDTVKHFVCVYGDENEYFFISGADSLAQLSAWKDPEGILKYVRFVAVSRPGYNMDSVNRDGIIKVNMPGVDISSTIIRRRIKNREPVDFWLPVNVVKYIRNKGLYR